MGDGAFAHMENVQKPFQSKQKTPHEKNFNKKLSSARVSVENAFGIECKKFDILKTAINKLPEFVEKIVMACCVLHNVIIDKEGRKTMEKEEDDDLEDYDDEINPKNRVKKGDAKNDCLEHITENYRTTFFSSRSELGNAKKYRTDITNYLFKRRNSRK